MSLAGDDLPPIVIERLALTNPTAQAMGAERLFDYTEEDSSFDERLGRCYELAAKAFFDLSVYQPLFDAIDLPTPTVLVHGSWHVETAPKRIDHAWVLLSDRRVWEPITSLICDRATFYRYTRAEDALLYDGTTTLQKMLRHQNFGPWD